MSKKNEGAHSAKFVAEGSNALALAGLAATCVGAFAAWPAALVAGGFAFTGVCLFGPEYNDPVLNVGGDHGHSGDAH